MSRLLIFVLISLAAADWLIYAELESEVNIPQSEKSVRISFPWEPKNKWVLVGATGDGYNDLPGSKGYHNHELNRQEFRIMCNIFFEDHDSCRVGTHEIKFWRRKFMGDETKSIKINFV